MYTLVPAKKGGRKEQSIHITIDHAIIYAWKEMVQEGVYTCVIVFEHVMS